MSQDSEKPSPNENLQQRTVLVVDDDSAFLSSLTPHLKAAGFSVFAVGSEAAAFSILEKRLIQLNEPRIDIILSDLMMPDVDGKEFLQNIRRDLNFQAIPFILFSGAIDQEMAKGFAILDVDGILLKPFTIPALLKEIESAKARREAKDLARLMKNLRQ